MPYNQHLAQRIHTILATYSGIVEKKMFGGVGFMLHGNMVCGVQRESLIVRVGSENNDQALSQPYVRPFVVTGSKLMSGWVLVDPGGLATDLDLQQWVEQGYTYASSLPKKA